MSTIPKPTELQLLKRTREAVSVLRDEYEKQFRPNSVQRLDRIKNRLYGLNGFYIQWTDTEHIFGQCTLHRVMPDKGDEPPAGTEAEAIEAMQKRIDRGGFQPDAAKTPMRRVEVSQ